MSEFNPGDHTIDEVNAYLEKNPTELQVVLKAEKAGKNRVSLVSALEEQAKSVPVPAEPLPVTVQPDVKTDTVFDKSYEVTADRGYRVQKPSA